MTDPYSTIMKFFQEGGVFLYPIALVFAIGLAIALERWIFLSREKSKNIKAFSDFLPLLRTTDMEKMQQFSRESRAPVTRIIACGLDMMKVSKQRADVENSMSEGMLEIMPQLQKRTGYLSVLANVATLLGLLGTIIGLISAFTAVSNVDPAQKSQLLSQSISVAMNTTAFGLIAAIPLLILHAILQNKTTSIVSSIEMSAVKFLNLMTLNRFIEAGIARSAHEPTQFPQAQADATQFSQAQAEATQFPQAQAEATQFPQAQADATQFLQAQADATQFSQAQTEATQFLQAQAEHNQPQPVMTHASQTPPAPQIPVAHESTSPTASENEVPSNPMTSQVVTELEKENPPKKLASEG